MAGAVTIDAVVARSKVAKSTIYRHWETRDDLLLDCSGSAGRPACPSRRSTCRCPLRSASSCTPSSRRPSTPPAHGRSRR
ncbi:MAG TPA: helix-turn-helix domain-containing protein [Mycobacteriales bacterium]|nr:helix-turn-helix domain-containing protein [Mycobacteriales bacterium]